jgi:transposase-like protein
MSKFEVVCPFCRKPNGVEKNSFGVSAHGLQKIQCSHCSKRWEENLSDTGGLVKSAPAPSSELAALRVLVRARAYIWAES